MLESQFEHIFIAIALLNRITTAEHAKSALFSEEAISATQPRLSSSPASQAQDSAR